MKSCNKELHDQLNENLRELAQVTKSKDMVDTHLQHARRTVEDER